MPCDSWELEKLPQHTQNIQKPPKHSQKPLKTCQQIQQLPKTQGKVQRNTSPKYQIIPKRIKTKQSFKKNKSSKNKIYSQVFSTGIKIIPKTKEYKLLKKMFQQKEKLLKKKNKNIPKCSKSFQNIQNIPNSYHLNE